MIAAPATARLVVDAGPGTGKTATAAGRIAALIGQGIAPDSLWTISFSRAAVGEMRQRLVALGGADMALGHVTTLDSLAWYLRAEDGEDGMVLEGHDRAIEETLLGLRARDPQMQRRIAAIRHFTIDEAQDLVGVRALLVVELLAALPDACGATILTDEAQAIYGFSAGMTASSFTADTVARHLLDLPDSAYRLHRLSQVHRTGDRRLLRLFETARAKALHPTPNPRTKLARMRRNVSRQAHARVKSGGDAQTLILYRSRAEVLAAARARFEKGQPYRLRLSGLPVMLYPWIATVLGDYEAGMLPRWEFETLWANRIGGDPAPAWAILLQAMGTPEADRIAMPRLLAILRTSHPPSELCRFDPGDAKGPIIGTIHASKGREMAHVQLMLPQGKSGGDDPDAEARVLFVGATRARERLEIGTGLRLGARRLGNGRVFVPVSATAAQVELGRPGDFDWLAGMPDISIGSRLGLAFVAGSLQVSFVGNSFGVATSALMADLREIRARLAGGADYSALTGSFDGLAFLGLYTLALNPATPRQTGLQRAPAVSGFSTCNF